LRAIVLQRDNQTDPGLFVVCCRDAELVQSAAVVLDFG
jgi:hypothetical protein